MTGPVCERLLPLMTDDSVEERLAQRLPQTEAQQRQAVVAAIEHGLDGGAHLDVALARIDERRSDVHTLVELDYDNVLWHLVGERRHRRLHRGGVGVHAAVTRHRLPSETVRQAGGATVSRVVDPRSARGAL